MTTVGVRGREGEGGVVVFLVSIEEVDACVGREIVVVVGGGRKEEEDDDFSKRMRGLSP